MCHAPCCIPHAMQNNLGPTPDSARQHTPPQMAQFPAFFSRRGAQALQNAKSLAYMAYLAVWRSAGLQFGVFQQSERSFGYKHMPGRSCLRGTQHQMAPTTMTKTIKRHGKAKQTCPKTMTTPTTTTTAVPNCPGCVTMTVNNNIGINRNAPHQRFNGMLDPGHLASSLRITLSFGFS